MHGAHWCSDSENKQYIIIRIYVWSRQKLTDVDTKRAALPRWSVSLADFLVFTYLLVYRWDSFLPCTSKFGGCWDMRGQRGWWQRITTLTTYIFIHRRNFRGTPYRGTRTPTFGVGRTVPHSSGAWQQNNSDCPSPNTEDTQKVHYNITGFNSCSKLRFSNVSCVWNGWGIGP